MPKQDNDISEEKLQQPNSKKVKRGFLRSLFCCLGKKKNKNQNAGEFVCGQESPLVYGTPRYLLPPVRHQDMHKKCMVIDLDETLVHSSFKVCSGVLIIVFTNAYLKQGKFYFNIQAAIAATKIFLLLVAFKHQVQILTKFLEDFLHSNKI